MYQCITNSDMRKDPHVVLQLLGWLIIMVRTNYTATCLPSRKLSKLDEPDTAGEAGTSSKVMYSYGLPHTVEQKQDDQLEQTYSCYVRIREVALKTCQRRWTIGRCGERGSGISVLAARHDDDDDINLCKSTLSFLSRFGLVSLFNGISTFAGYLMPKPFS